MKWEKNIHRVVPYVAGEQPKDPGIIKLNTNEFPYPPAPEVEAAAKKLKYEDLRLYPDQEVTLLTAALADYYGLDKKQVFVGVGSDDVLAMSFLTYFNSELPILFPDVTYSFYDVWANLYQIPFKVCELDQDWHIRPGDYCQPNGGIIFPNPNAPTGLLESLAVVEEIIRANQDVVVIVDEAYIDFGGKSALSLIDRYDNLLVVHTFSKSRALAGLRIGFAMGSGKLLKYLYDTKFSYNSYTMNLPAQILGGEVIKADDYFKESGQKIIHTRERFKKEMKALGFSFPDSQANFLFVTHERIPARELFESLRQGGIYVRHWDKPRISNYLRITIGTDDEMDKVTAFLKQYLTE